MLKRYDEVMTSGTPQVEKIGGFVSSRLLCDVFLVTHGCVNTSKTAAHSHVPK